MCVCVRACVLAVWFALVLFLEIAGRILDRVTSWVWGLTTESGKPCHVVTPPENGGERVSRRRSWDERSVYKIMDVSILKLCWWWLEEAGCLFLLPFQREALWGPLTCLFIMQGNEGFDGFLSFLSHHRSACPSYWGICFHFQVNFQNFFPPFEWTWRVLTSFRKGKAKTWPVSPEVFTQLRMLQVSFKSPRKIISFFRWWWWSWAVIAPFFLFSFWVLGFRLAAYFHVLQDFLIRFGLISAEPSKSCSSAE